MNKCTSTNMSVWGCLRCICKRVFEGAWSRTCPSNPADHSLTAVIYLPSNSHTHTLLHEHVSLTAYPCMRTCTSSIPVYPIRQVAVRPQEMDHKSQANSSTIQSTRDGEGTLIWWKGHRQEPRPNLHTSCFTFWYGMEVTLSHKWSGSVSITTFGRISFRRFLRTNPELPQWLQKQTVSSYTWIRCVWELPHMVCWKQNPHTTTHASHSH